MADFFTSGQLAVLAAGTVRCDFLSKLDFVSATRRVWNGNTPLVVDGNTYLPLFGMGTFDGLASTDGTTSEAVTTAVHGLPGTANEFLASALAETPEADQQLQTLYLQLFDKDWQVSGTPIPIFWGFMQPPQVNRTPMQDGEGGTQGITLQAENIFYNRSRAPNGRNTDRDQQRRSPGDKFFGFVNSLLFKAFTYPDF